MLPHSRDEGVLNGVLRCAQVAADGIQLHDQATVRRGVQVLHVG